MTDIEGKGRLHGAILLEAIARVKVGIANLRATHHIAAEDRNYIIYNYQHQGSNEIRMVSQWWNSLYCMLCHER